MTITPIHREFVTEIAGVDLTSDLDEAMFRAIHAAFDRFAVLVFRDQALDDERQIAFSERFGRLEEALARDVFDAGQSPKITRLTNVDGNGDIEAPDSTNRIYRQGDEHWHSDSSFKPAPAKYSLLSAREVPPVGGETQFADVRDAYDEWRGSLAGHDKRTLEVAQCVHSIVYSRGQISGDIFTDEEKRGFAPVQHPLVRTHPTTGRKGFLVGSHASHLVGRPEEEGRALIHALNEWSTQPRFVHTHRWSRNDLVGWDNRSVLHRGRLYEHARYRRIMHRTTVEGDRPRG